MGICGTCKVKRLEGAVEMAHNGGITDEDVEEGYILSCCSVPTGMWWWSIKADAATEGAVSLD